MEPTPKPEAEAIETPAAMGYRMPAEWEPHAATWIAWPHNREDWPGKFAPIPWVYAEIVRNLVRGEHVHILVEDGSTRRRASDMLDKVGVDLGRVTFHKVKTDRVWTRDSGPSFVVRESGPEGEGDGAADRVGLVDWRFNAWAKYDNHRHDDRLPRKITRRLGQRRWKPYARREDGSETRVVLEGGAIDVNGRGTLLTTEECLLSDVQARNPGVAREELERVLGEYLGVRHVVWLGRGIVGDDTHGHVDDLARFVGPSTIVLASESIADDENAPILAENRERLTRAVDQDGQTLSVIELPMPSPLVFEGQRLPASYANFYIANGVVLVPTFNDPADRRALDTLAKLFPDRQVIGIHSVDLIWGLGALHCMTQQQPA